MQNDMAQITALVDAYVDMLYTADTERVADIFYPEALVQSCADDAIVSVDMDGFRNRMLSRPVPRDRGDVMNPQLVNLVMATETLAQVTLHSTMLSLFFVDTLTLLKCGGTWKIINKTFCSRPV